MGRVATPMCWRCHVEILVLPHARERTNAFFVAEVKCSNGGVKNENYFCATALNYRPLQYTIICPDGKCNDSLCCIRTLILHFCFPLHRLSHRVRACFGLSPRVPPSLLILLPFRAAFFPRSSALTCDDLDGDGSRQYPCDGTHGWKRVDNYDGTPCTDGSCGNDECCKRTTTTHGSGTHRHRHRPSPL